MTPPADQGEPKGGGKQRRVRVPAGTLAALMERYELDPDEVADLVYVDEKTVKGWLVSGMPSAGLFQLLCDKLEEPFADLMKRGIAGAAKRSERERSAIIDRAWDRTPRLPKTARE